MSNPQDLLSLVSKMVLAAGRMKKCKEENRNKRKGRAGERRQNSKVLAEIKKVVEQLDLLRIRCKEIGSLKLQGETNMHIREIR